MKQLSPDEVLKLAKSKTIEEFLVNKDLLGFHGRKFCMKHTIEILATMAAQHHDSKFACKLVNEDEHFTLGHWSVSVAMFDRYWSFDGQGYIKRNLYDIWRAIHMYDPAY